jgi:redox-sensitive bicupin YhaK (pirin superfamily)
MPVLPKFMNSDSAQELFARPALPDALDIVIPGRARDLVGAFETEMFYADVPLEAGAKLQLPVEHEERAIYVFAGSVELAPEGGPFNAGELLVFKTDETITFRVQSGLPARLMLLGGVPLDGPRHIWWNFVSSSMERIEQPKED